MKKIVIAILLAVLTLVGLDIVQANNANADEPCPVSPATLCNPPTGTQPPSHDLGPAGDGKGEVYPKTPVEAGLTTSMAMHEVPVTPQDTDPDGGGLAKTCYGDSSKDKSWDYVIDEVDLTQQPILWRATNVETILIFKWCLKQITSSEYHYWYSPTSIFFDFDMRDTTFVGTRPRYFCQSFDYFLIDGIVRDGTGKSLDVPPLTVNCLSGHYGNSNYRDVGVPRKKFHHVVQYGYPKWSATVKDVNIAAPDHYFDNANGNLDPN